MKDSPTTALDRLLVAAIKRTRNPRLMRWLRRLLEKGEQAVITHCRKPSPPRDEGKDHA